MSIKLKHFVFDILKKFPPTEDSGTELQTKISTNQQQAHETRRRNLQNTTSYARSGDDWVPNSGDGSVGAPPEKKRPRGRMGIEESVLDYLSFFRFDVFFKTGIRRCWRTGLVDVLPTLVYSIIGFIETHEHLSK